MEKNKKLDKGSIQNGGSMPQKNNNGKKAYQLNKNLDINLLPCKTKWDNV